MLFLSFSGKDEDSARALALGLGAAGIDVWCSAIEDTIPMAAIVWSDISVALDECTGFLVLIGRQDPPPAVQLEVNLAIGRYTRSHRSGRAEFPIVSILPPGTSIESIPAAIRELQRLHLPSDVADLTRDEFAEIAVRLRRLVPTSVAAAEGIQGVSARPPSEPVGPRPPVGTHTAQERSERAALDAGPAPPVAFEDSGVLTSAAAAAGPAPESGAHRPASGPGTSPRHSTRAIAIVFGVSTAIILGAWGVQSLLPPNHSPQNSSPPSASGDDSSRIGGEPAGLESEKEGPPETAATSGEAWEPSAGFDSRQAAMPSVRPPAATEWDEVNRRLAEDAHFQGVRLAPRPGLVPLGRAAGSSLEEFAVEATGRVPERDAEGGFVPTEDMALVLVLVPAGTFEMGSPETELGSGPDEAPLRTVTFDRPFFIGRTEVTQAMWETVMSTSPSTFKGPRLPVTDVSWDDVSDFCARLGLVLPSEAQWEYACRAKTRTRYWHGPSARDLDLAGWFAGNTEPRPQRVEQKLGNPWGLFDVHGNVGEWCADTWHRNYVNAPVDGSAWVDQSSPDRVARGGSFEHLAEWARSAVRFRANARQRLLNLGFRPALSIPP